MLLFHNTIENFTFISSYAENGSGQVGVFERSNNNDEGDNQLLCAIELLFFFFVLLSLHPTLFLFLSLTLFLHLLILFSSPSSYLSTSLLSPLLSLSSLSPSLPPSLPPSIPLLTLPLTSPSLSPLLILPPLPSHPNLPSLLPSLSDSSPSPVWVNTVTLSAGKHSAPGDRFGYSIASRESDEVVLIGKYCETRNALHVRY